MMKISKELSALTIVMTASMTAGPVYAHEGSALHGLIDALIPTGFLILSLVLIHCRLASRRRP